MSVDTIKRDMGKGGWYWIDKAVLSAYGSTLGASGIAVYNALAFHVHSKTQRCFPSQKTIAGLVGLSRRTVARQIKNLAGLGLIRIEKKGISCEYLLNSAATCAKKSVDVCQKRQPTYDTSAH